MKVHDIITNQILKELKKGKIPWKKPWIANFPKNLVSMKEYQGINTLLLAMLEYKEPYFLTYKQAKQLGGYVKSGEKGHIVVYWNNTKVKKDEDGKEKKIEIIPFMRYYKVFNITQCQDVPYPKKKKNGKIKAYEDIIKMYKNKPKIINDTIKAYYSVKRDVIGIPPASQFANSKSYYSTLYHEFIHSTGSPKRLERFQIDELSAFGSESYSKEELIAELGSAFLCAKVGIDNSQLKNSAGYIQGWLKALANDTKLIIGAASKAQKAVNYIVS